MAQAGGLSAQFGMVDEATYNTLATVTRFLEFNSETIERTIARIESSGLRPTRRVRRSNQWLPGRESVSGDVEFEVQTNGFGLLLKHMLGSAAIGTVSEESFTQTFKVGALDGKSFTCQTAAGDSGGTVRAFTYGGCKVSKWELMCEENGFLKLKTTIDAASESISTALASASYASTSIPFPYYGGSGGQGVVKLGGSEQLVKGFTLACDNSQALDRYFMRSTTPTQKREQLENTIRPITGTLKVEFESLALYEKFTKSEEFAAELLFEGAKIKAGSKKYTFKVDLAGMRFDGKGPDVAGEGLIDVDIPFTCLETGSAPTAVQVVYISDDSAA